MTSTPEAIKTIEAKESFTIPSKVVVTKDGGRKTQAETSDEESTYRDSDSECSDESGSEVDSDDEEGLSLNTQEIIDTDILFTVLKQFFISKNGRNIADILEDINTKLDRRHKHKGIKV
jgi:hypothetical protein